MAFETAPAALSALRSKYCMPEWMLATEVEIWSGDGGSRADAIGLNLWGSRGHAIYGFEIKVSRADFMQEMKNPEKAERIAALCDKWWLVIGAKEVAHPEEIPKGWGLIVPRGNKLVIKKQAVQNENVPEPDRSFMARMIYRASSIKDSKEALAAEFNRGQKQGRDRSDGIDEHERKRHQELKDTIQAFENTSGIRIRSWPSEGMRIGKIVRQLASRQIDQRLDRLERVSEVADDIQEYCRKRIGEIKEERPAAVKVQAELFGKDES